MTDEEAKDAILERAIELGEPLNVENLETAAKEILDPDRAFKFLKWLEKHGQMASNLLNKTLLVEGTGKILGEIHARSSKAAGKNRK